VVLRKSAMTFFALMACVSKRRIGLRGSESLKAADKFCSTAPKFFFLAST